MNRFIVKCKNESFKTYAVYDTSNKRLVDDTEDTDLETVNQYAIDENDDNEPAPEHGSIYGEPVNR